jgi:hypothetical protein
MVMNINLRKTTYGGTTNFLDSQNVRYIRGAITLDENEVTADATSGIKKLLAGTFVGKLTSGKYAKYAAGVKASDSTGAVADNNAILFEAKKAGTDGNKIKVSLVDPAGNSKPLTIGFANNLLTVSVATDEAGAITSKASDIIAAVNADIIASQYITAKNSGASTGAGVVAADTATLANGTNCNVTPTLILPEDVVFTSYTQSGGVAHADQVVTAIDSARVITSRLPEQPDDVVKANMPNITFA